MKRRIESHTSSAQLTGKASSSHTLPKYSICITHYNNEATVQSSLESILNQIDPEFEVVVIDNFSSDGSYEVLRKFEALGKIRLYRKRCSRGRGRQLAFENSKGEYIIAHLDMDDIFKPRLSELLEKYHRQAEGMILWVSSIVKGGFWGGEAILIAPRNLLNRIGGWNDLQVYEDWELCRRAASVGLYRHGVMSLIDETNDHPERIKSFFGRLTWKFVTNRDALRVGRPLQRKGKRLTLKQTAFKHLVGPLLMFLYGTYHNVPILEWDKSDAKSFVQLEA